MVSLRHLVAAFSGHLNQPSSRAQQRHLAGASEPPPPLRPRERLWEGFLLNGRLGVGDIVQDPLSFVLTVAGALKGTEEASVGFEDLLLCIACWRPAAWPVPAGLWVSTCAGL